MFFGFLHNRGPYWEDNYIHWICLSLLTCRQECYRQCTQDQETITKLHKHHEQTRELGLQLEKRSRRVSSLLICLFLQSHSSRGSGLPRRRSYGFVTRSRANDAWRTPAGRLLTGMPKSCHFNFESCYRNFCRILHKRQFKALFYVRYNTVTNICPEKKMFLKSVCYRVAQIISWHQRQCFDTQARWQPVTSRLSYGKIEDCEQSSTDIESELFVAVWAAIRP